MFQVSRFRFHNQKGFTLVELLVALTLFMIVMDITVSVFISMVGHQKRMLAEQEFLSQTSFVAELMSASLRQAVPDRAGNCLVEGQNKYPGYVYLLTRYDAGSNSTKGIKFVTKDNVCQEFFVDSDGILKESKDQDEGQPPQQILSGAFTIEDLQFVINGDKNLLGARSGEAIQPRVTIVLKAGLQKDGARQERIIQTTVSQLLSTD